MAVVVVGGGPKDGGGVSPMVLMGIQSEGYRVICDRWVVGGSVVIGGRRSEDYGASLIGPRTRTMARQVVQTCKSSVESLNLNRKNGPAN